MHDEAGVNGRFEIIVNGKSVHVETDGETPLLWVLRNELGLRGSRFGCGTEDCGACMVLIDGEPAFSCTRDDRDSGRQSGDDHRRPVGKRHALAAGAGIPR